MVIIAAHRHRPDGRHRAQEPHQEKGRQDHSPTTDHLQVRHRHVRDPIQSSRLPENQHDVNSNSRRRSTTLPAAPLEPYRQPLHT